MYDSVWIYVQTVFGIIVSAFMIESISKQRTASDIEREGKIESTHISLSKPLHTNVSKAVSKSSLSRYLNKIIIHRKLAHMFFC